MVFRQLSISSEVVGSIEVQKIQRLFPNVNDLYDLFDTFTLFVFVVIGAPTNSDERLLSLSRNRDSARSSGVIDPLFSKSG